MREALAVNGLTSRQLEKSAAEIKRDAKLLYLSGILKRGVDART